MKTFFWVIVSEDSIVVYQVENNEPTLVVPATEVGYRNPFQAVRQELVKKGLISAPTHAKSGGWKYDETEARYFQL